MTGFVLEGSTDVTSGFTPFVSYTGASQHTLNIVTDSLIEG